MTYYEKIFWIDEYITKVAPYIFVRPEDSILIKIPNEAHKLNGMGIKVLTHLLQGESVYSIVDRYPDKERVARDLHLFFCDLRSLLKGCFHENQERRAVDKRTFSLPFNTLPVLSEIAVTYQCNLACQFCYASCGCQKKTQPDDLGSVAIKDILTIIKKEGKIPSVSFTGGEPTIRSDLPDLIRHAKSLQMWTNLITNGTLLTPGLVAALKSSGLDSVQISLESADAFRHDAIVQVKGAFEKTLAGLKQVQEAGIRVHTNTTISKLNIDVLPPILDLVRSMGLNKFSMNLLMPEGAALQDMDNILVTYSEIGDIVLEVQQYARQTGLEFMWYSPTPMCIFNPVVSGLGNKGCAACDGLLSIAPNGDILPCSSYPHSMGNILEMRGHFQEKWRGPEFKYFQEKRFAHAFCQRCEHFAVCNGGCPLYWRQVGYGELISHAQEGVA